MLEMPAASCGLQGSELEAFRSFTTLKPTYSSFKVDLSAAFCSQKHFETFKTKKIAVRIRIYLNDRLLTRGVPCYR